MLRDSAATEKVNEQVPSNDGNWGHGDTMLLLFNTQCVSWAGRNVGSVVKQDLTSLPTSDMTLGLNFLICTMGMEYVPCRVMCLVLCLAWKSCAYECNLPSPSASELE